MVKQWGFVNIPSPTTFKDELLLGYPFQLYNSVNPDLPVDFSYFRQALGDNVVSTLGGSAEQEVVDYDNLDYLKEYLN